ncbi:TPA: hypothetical protein ACTAEG_004073 [Salmonella enterica subsp. enterica serovar Lexington]
MIKEPPEGYSLQANGVEKMNTGDDIYALHNFEFLAITFAKMAAQGRTMDIDTVIGNMDETHRKWFTERYQHWLAISRQESQ